jgi:hypothetical protein
MRNYALVRYVATRTYLVRCVATRTYLVRYVAKHIIYLVCYIMSPCVLII